MTKNTNLKASNINKKEAWHDDTQQAEESREGKLDVPKLKKPRAECYPYFLPKPICQTMPSQTISTETCEKIQSDAMPERGPVSITQTK